MKQWAVDEPAQLYFVLRPAYLLPTSGKRQPARRSPPRIGSNFLYRV